MKKLLLCLHILRVRERHEAEMVVIETYAKNCGKISSEIKLFSAKTKSIAA